MGAKQSIEVENKAAGTKLAISRLSDEYLSFVEATTAEVSERASEVLKTGPLGDFSLSCHFVRRFFSVCDKVHICHFILLILIFFRPITFQIFPVLFGIADPSFTSP